MEKKTHRNSDKTTNAKKGEQNEGGHLVSINLWAENIN